MADVIPGLDEKHRINIERRVEKNRWGRLVQERDVARSQASKEGIAHAEQVADTVEAQLNQINTSLSETPLPGTMADYQKQIAQAKQDAELHPAAQVSSADQEHAALVDFVSQNNSAKVLEDARPANIRPENIASGVDQTRQTIAESVRQSAENRNNFLSKVQIWKKGNGYASLTQTQVAAPRPSLATKPGIDQAPFQIGQTTHGDRSVQRPQESLIIKQGETGSMTVNPQASIRDKVRGRIDTFMKSLPRKKV